MKMYAAVMTCLLAGFPAAAPCAAVEPEVVKDFPVCESAVRSSEGDFVRLKDGRIMFAYSRYDEHVKDRGMGDHDPADIVACFSDDEGKTWGGSEILVRRPANAWNVMSVDLERLADGRLALFYCMKRFRGDCRPYVSFSSDEGRAWTEGKCLFPDDRQGYYAFLNQSVCQTSRGRLVVPFYGNGRMQCLLSDDMGATWRYSEAFRAFDTRMKHVALDESKVMELANGSLVMFSRSYVDWQYWTYSLDGGETWGPSVPSGIVSPGSPLAIIRLKNGDWLMAWNDLRGNPGKFSGGGSCHGSRTPMTVAVSKDEGRTWIHRRVLEGDTHPWGYWYCYPAMMETDDGNVLIHYCYIGRRKKGCLCESHIVRVPLSWIYAAPVWDRTYGTKGILDRLQ